MSATLNGNGMGSDLIIDCRNTTNAVRDATCWGIVAVSIITPILFVLFCLFASWNWYKNRPK